MPPLPVDPLLPLQWYLDSRGHSIATVDINVRGALDDFSGKGVSIGLFDTPVELDHPDLAGNTDFFLAPGEIDAYPAGGYLPDPHGTATAGIIAAQANNIGGTGIAHDAVVTSIRTGESGTVVISRLLESLPYAGQYDVYLAGYTSFNAFDTEMGAFNGTIVATAIRTAAETGRGGLGSNFVIGAGNARTGDSASGMIRMQADRHAIAVGAVNHVGMISSYSSEGSNVFIVAPSSDTCPETAITTTDVSGPDGYNTGLEAVPDGYTTTFGGTSASSPMVVGVIALMLEANPGLGWRDVRDILAISARHAGSDIGAPPNILERAGWQMNAATTLNGGQGYHVSVNYGFGLVDARAAVRLAESWQGTETSAAQTSANEASVATTFTGPATIPSDRSPPLVTLLTLDGGVVAETVTIYLDITHGNAVNLRIRLISPEGTESVIFNADAARPSIFGLTTVMRPWTFTSQAFRGENSEGEWRLLVEEIRPSLSNAGRINLATLTVYGDAASDDTFYYLTDEYGTLDRVTADGVIDDAIGYDTLNAAAVTRDLDIDLRYTSGTTIGLVGDVALSRTPGTRIEAVIGGDGDDRIRGNLADNRLEGWRQRRLCRDPHSQPGQNR